MQRGNNRYYFFGLLFEDALGHIGGRGMRNRVMHMQEVKVIVSDHIHHCTCKCGFIRRIIKQRVSWYLYLVVINIRYKPVQPDRLLVRYEMHMVILLRKGLA